MNPPTPPILVTSALPYANGPIHLGHLVTEYGPDRHLGPLPAAARPRLPVCLRRRCPRHAHHASCRGRRYHARALIEQVGIERRDFAGFLVSSTTSTPRTRPRTATTRSGSTRRSMRPATSPGGVIARPTTSRPACSCRIASCAAPAPAAVPRTSTATAARPAAPPIRPPTWSRTPARWSAARRPPARVRAPVLQAGRLREPCCALDALRRTCRRQWLQQARRVVRGRPARTGTSPATRPTSASEIPGDPGQVLLRLAGRADRLHGELR
jgi:hypothetical protein